MIISILQRQAEEDTLKKIDYNGRISIEGKTDEIEKDAKTALALLKKMEECEYE